MDIELVMGHAVNLMFRDYHNISPFILIRSADLEQKLFWKPWPVTSVLHLCQSGMSRMLATDEVLVIGLDVERNRVTSWIVRCLSFG